MTDQKFIIIFKSLAEKSSVSKVGVRKFAEVARDRNRLFDFIKHSPLAAMQCLQTLTDTGHHRLALKALSQTTARQAFYEAHLDVPAVRLLYRLADPETTPRATLWRL